MEDNVGKYPLIKEEDSSSGDLKKIQSLRRKINLTNVEPSVEKPKSVVNTTTTKVKREKPSINPNMEDVPDWSEYISKDIYVL